ncbi:MAG: methyl-accepting chemotaxis protein [Candidatus Magnetoovum sp. WYHC-5]|nr:methyl-accepting chemotaxis protein [Candidatus Magnetoovum sp. WYHC-5]
MKSSIKVKILLNIIVILLIAGGVIIFKDFKDSKAIIINENAAKLTTFHKVFVNDLQAKTEDLSMAMELFLQNPEVIKAFSSFDRQRLADLTVGYYKEALKPKYGIDQFQFHLPPAISFLRVNEPAKFGDDLSSFRKTVINANVEQKAVLGLEVGRSGLGLRVVYPIRYEGKHIGSVEFGGGVSALMKAAKEATATEYAVGVFGEVFKAAKRFEGKDTDVVRGDVVFFEYSEPKIRDIIAKMGKNANAKDTTIVEMDKASFVSIEFDVEDYSKNTIGKIVVLKDITAQMESMWHNVMVKGFGVIAAVIIISIILFRVIIMVVIRPLESAMRFTNNVGAGNLSCRIDMDRKDEMGRLSSSLMAMASRFTGIIINVKSASDNVEASSNELSAFSTQISTGMIEQADRSAQIATATAQMAQNITEIARNAANIANAASHTLSVARNGEGIVFKTAQEVKEIEGSVSELSGLIKSLGERSKQIGNIVGTISEIADQTNLLALNAAIESARAGEVGRGFAVVADEVRKLSEKTAKATTEIITMVNAIQKGTSKAIDSMKDSLLRVETGVGLTAEAGTALKVIVESVNDLKANVNQIASSTEEMSTVSAQIEKDIEFVASVSDENKQSAIRLEDASKNLQALSVDLREVVNQFKIEDT